MIIIILLVILAVLLFGADIVLDMAGALIRLAGWLLIGAVVLLFAASTISAIFA